MYKRLLQGILVFGLAALAPPAQAQSSCAPREVIAERLDKRFGEVPTAGGLRSPLELFELWSSPETGTWTALATYANGISCVFASGTDWHQITPEPAEADRPS